MICLVMVPFLLGLAFGIISAYISYHKLWAKRERLRQRMRGL